MPDMLRDALVWLAGQLKANVSQIVTLRRNGFADQTGVAATIGATTEDVDDHEGGLIRLQARDYLIQAADYRPGNVQSLPKSGDRIIEVDGSQFEAMDVPGDGVWRWSDRYRILLRVHTKKVAS